MADNETIYRRLLYEMEDQQRWLQGSPVLPDVWKTFVAEPGHAVDLLVTPHRKCPPGALAKSIRNAVGDVQEEEKEKVVVGNPQRLADAAIAHNQSVVVASLTFDELVQFVVPLSPWFQSTIAPHLDRLGAYIKMSPSNKQLKRFLDHLIESSSSFEEFPAVLLWWLRLIGHVSLLQEGEASPSRNKLRSRLRAILEKVAFEPGSGPQLFRVALNRPAEIASRDSYRTIKADAARRVFEIDTSGIRWAVLDSGIDPRHPAFAEPISREDDDEGDAEPREFNSRVGATYDFTKVRRIVALASTPGDDAEAQLTQKFSMTSDQAGRLRTALLHRGDIDWVALGEVLRVDQADPEALDDYVADLDPHGTHVAGILGGAEAKGAFDEEDFHGTCPDIQLIDLRVLDRHGASKDRKEHREFDIIAALQFIGHLNSTGDEPFVHGVNLSIQLQHNPRDFACGRTPVCEACNRLVANGVVVVAAAGNMGIDRDAADANTTEGSFRDISIADPGNAEAVITVGSTHRKRPHTYGVSFFSSRGPTGDGRLKPDLVAPGEKIVGPVKHHAYDTMSGTSQAAPQVSGAAAMLLSQYRELIGDPQRVKQILCEAATDLGRERYFQGAGLIDILRALQSI